MASFSCRLWVQNKRYGREKRVAITGHWLVGTVTTAWSGLRSGSIGKALLLGGRVKEICVCLWRIREKHDIK